MDLALLKAILGMTAYGIDEWGTQVASRRHKRKAHRYRGQLQQQSKERYSKSAPIVAKSVRQAQGRVRGASRASGTYRPDVVAKQLGEMDINLGLALTKLREEYDRQALGEYHGMRYGQAPQPRTGATEAVLGAMDIYESGKKNPIEDYMRRMTQRPMAPDPFRPGQYMAPTGAQGGY